MRSEKCRRNSMMQHCALISKENVVGVGGEATKNRKRGKAHLVPKKEVVEE
jgi:hypothetical protein